MYPLNRDLKRPLPGVWNRLEPRPLQKDFSRVLRAEVYDPLWMLNRQWQFGEFKGEDTGSAVFARVTLQHTQLSRYATQDGVQPYTEAVPLEVQVESEGVAFDLKMHVQFSLYFKKLFQRSNPVLPQALYDSFVTTYRLAPPTFANAEERARHETQSGAWLLWKTASKKGLLDGEALYSDLKYNLEHNLSIASLSSYSATATEETQLQTLSTALIAWFEQTYQSFTSAWQAERLEYQFANAVPSLQGGGREALVAEEYYHGKLDWYAYDLDIHNSTPLVNSTPLAGEDSTVHTESLTVLPSPVQFGGMPSSRWWEMEDGYVNLGDLAQDTVDVPKVLLAQFGLVFNNDWQIVPIRRSIGSLSAVTRIIVTDVFGQRTAVNSANVANADWSLYNLSHKDSTNVDGRLFIPPTLDKTLESEPVEVVRFARDEMANQVWGIEQYIPSLMGEGMDARLASEAVKAHLANYLAQTFADLLPPADGLAAYYALDGDARAQSSTLDGVAQQTTPTTNRFGAFNAALRMAGTSSSYVRLPDAPELKPTDALTVSLWVHPAILMIPEQYLVFTKNTQSNDVQAYALSIHNNKFRAYQNAPNAANTTVDSSTILQPNTWYHIALTIDDDLLKLYVNGVLEGTVAAPQALDYAPGAAVILGGTDESGFDRPFEGSLDEVRFYNRSLTATEIARLHNNGQPFPVLAPQSAVTNRTPADFIYHYLLNDVPEHWIPFIPVRLPGSSEVVLQRGKMLRTVPYLPEELQYARPAGVLLNEHTQTSPNLYFLKEEEIPRAGVEVKRIFQRTRWLNGGVFTWMGRQKRAGRGEIESQLRYDGLEPFEKI